MTAEPIGPDFIPPGEAERRARAEAQRAAQHPANPRRALDEVAGRMAAFQSRTVAAAQAQQAAQGQLRAELLARCPEPARALQAAADALRQAESDLAQAEQALQTFSSTPPASRDDNRAWAARRGQLRDERDGLALLAEKAREQHQAAGAVLRGALLAARSAEAAHLRAELEERKAATDAKVAGLWKQIHDAAQEHNEAVAAPAARLQSLEGLPL